VIDGLLGALQALHDDGVVMRGVTPATCCCSPTITRCCSDTDLAHAESKNELIESLMASVRAAFGAPSSACPGRPALGPWTDMYGVAATECLLHRGEPPPPVHEWPPEGAHEPMPTWCRASAPAPMRRTTAPRLLNALDARSATSGAGRAACRIPPLARTLPEREPRAAHNPAHAPAPAPPAPRAGQRHRARPPAEPYRRLRSTPVPGMVSSRFIEPDPEPGRGDIDAS